jgi:hypothetical protein
MRCSSATSATAPSTPTTSAPAAMLHVLRDAGGTPIVSGAWVLRFGKGTIGTKHTPVFAAGSADVTHGLLGAIQPAR